MWGNWTIQNSEIYHPLQDLATLFWEREKSIILDPLKHPCKPKIKGKEKHISVLMNKPNFAVSISAFEKGNKRIACVRKNQSIKFSIILIKNDRGKSYSLQTHYLWKERHSF